MENVKKIIGKLFNLNKGNILIDFDDYKSRIEITEDYIFIQKCENKSIPKECSTINSGGLNPQDVKAKSTGKTYTAELIESNV